jgi:ACS family glucarate transporter-like MFS transporter
LFGAGEAGAFPALSKVVYNWFPVKERGIVQGINFSGSRIGAALGLPLVAILIESFGWRHTFLIFGVVGVVFGLIWFFLFKDKPEDSKLISETEKEYIIKNRQQGSLKKEILPFSTILKSPNMWLAMVQYICSNFTFYFTLTWMYPYIKEKFMLGSVEAGMYAAVPLIAGACGNWISGILVDFIYSKGKLKMSRQLPAIIGFILAAVGMILVTQANSPLLSVIFMSLAVLGADMTLSPSWAFCIDIGKENAGAVSGTMNMAGNLGAFVTIIAYPYLFQWTGSNEPFFYICAALSVIAIAAWWFMKPEVEIKKN